MGRSDSPTQRYDEGKMCGRLNVKEENNLCTIPGFWKLLQRRKMMNEPHLRLDQSVFWRGTAGITIFNIFPSGSNVPPGFRDTGVDDSSPILPN